MCSLLRLFFRLLLSIISMHTAMRTEVLRNPELTIIDKIYLYKSKFRGSFCSSSTILHCTYYIIRVVHSSRRLVNDVCHIFELASSKSSWRPTVQHGHYLLWTISKQNHAHAVVLSPTAPTSCCWTTPETQQYLMQAGEQTVSFRCCSCKRTFDTNHGSFHNASGSNLLLWSVSASTAWHNYYYCSCTKEILLENTTQESYQSLAHVCSRR